MSSGLSVVQESLVETGIADWEAVARLCESSRDTLDALNGAAGDEQ